MDLTSPAQKISKSSSSAAGALRLLDEPDVLRLKIMRAVTDAGTAVTYDANQAPGVANLLDILGGCTGTPPPDLAARFDRYGELKRAVADAVVDSLAPLRERYLRLAAEPDHVRAVLRRRRRRSATSRVTRSGRQRRPSVSSPADQAPASTEAKRACRVG